jgi:hypothetical protein
VEEATQGGKCSHGPLEYYCMKDKLPYPGNDPLAAVLSGQCYTVLLSVLPQESQERHLLRGDKQEPGLKSLSHPQGCCVLSEKIQSEMGTTCS